MERMKKEQKQSEWKGKSAKIIKREGFYVGLSQFSSKNLQKRFCHKFCRKSPLSKGNVLCQLGDIQRRDQICCLVELFQIVHKICLSVEQHDQCLLYHQSNFE